MLEKEIHRLIKISYKKLKASVYYDKTQLPLRDQIVLFEDENFENKLSELTKAIMSDSIKWMKSITNSIKVYALPEKV